jgi:tetratricopeptide (TPR) repeat protein
MAVIFRFTSCLPGLIVLTCLAGSASSARAQADIASSGEQLYEQATSARTIDEYDQVIERIERIADSNGSEALGQYLTRLQAWVLNRRGERYTERAAEALEGGDQRRALELDAKALEDYEASIALDSTRWKTLHNRGIAYALTGRPEDAVKDFTRVIQLKPNYVNAWFNRGELNYELGRYREAIADYSEAIRLKPDDAGFHTSRGHACFQQRDFSAAWEDYDVVVQLKPQNAVAIADRGEAYRAMGQWEAAANDFRRAIELDPHLARAYQSAAWLMATCPDERYRNPKLAVQAAEKAVAIQGDDYIYLDTLAAAYANDGQFTRAESTVSQAIALTPAEYSGRLKMRREMYRQRKPFRQILRSTTSQ